MALPRRMVVAVDPLAAAAAEEAARDGERFPPTVAPLRGALEWAALLAEVAPAELDLVSAVPEPLSLFPFLSEPVVQQEALLQDTRRLLEWIRERLEGALRGRSASVRTVAVPGSVEDTLIEQARAEGAELIVLGARPLSAAQRWLFGGTSLRLVRRAETPVLLARPSEKLRSGVLLEAIADESVQRISAAGSSATASDELPLRFLVAVDFSDASVVGLHTAIELAQSVDAEVIVLHCLTPPRTESLRLLSTRLRPDELIAEAREAAMERLQRLLEQTDQRAVVRGVRPEVRVGRPEIVLTDCVRQESVDLIVLGAGSAENLRRLVLGSTVERLLPHLGCSVWIARPPSPSAAS